MGVVELGLSWGVGVLVWWGGEKGESEDGEDR